MGYKCPFCKNTGKIRVGGFVGRNSGITAPCNHCLKGAQEKDRMEMMREAKKREMMLSERSKRI